jgi:hypothetical protein
VFAALAVQLTFGCATSASRGELDCPVALVPSSEIVRAGSQRYRVSIEVDGVLRRAEAASFRDGDAWVLVGFTPFNTRLFTLRQEGIDTTVEGGTLAQRFGIDPRQLQDAFHRAVFVRPPRAAPAGPRIAWSRGREDVRDTWRAGSLAMRVFAPSSGAPDRDAARISIEYIAMPPAGASSSWTIHNPSCGYHATVVTLEPRGSSSSKP